MVNTFFPFPLTADECKSMRTLMAGLRRNVRRLDDKRLGKQRVEAMQIHNALRKQTLGWQHHPATRMWRGHTRVLRLYMRVACQEWARRDFVNEKCAFWLRVTDPNYALDVDDEELEHAPVPPLPGWFTDDMFCERHRAALHHKNPSYYADFTDDYDAVPKDSVGRPKYIWPSTLEPGQE
jgi:hypothetical protein